MNLVLISKSGSTVFTLTTFTYFMKGAPRSMNYFSSPEEALDSINAMRPWATLALDCALRTRAKKSLTKPKKATKAGAKKVARIAPKKRKTKNLLF